jgi:preprotein translocase subunit YajC
MNSLGGLLFPLLILLLFIPIFLSGRKQRRQVQEMGRLQSSLQVDDVVTTTSGLRGTVVDVSYEDTVDLEIADGVVTTWLRASIRDKVLEGAQESAAPQIDADGVTTAEPAGSSAPTTTAPTTTARVDAPADPAGDANGTTPRP